MKKQLYNTPKVELTPISLSACIMSGGGPNNAPFNDNAEDPDSHMYAPKRVF